MTGQNIQALTVAMSKEIMHLHTLYLSGSHRIKMGMLDYVRDSYNDGECWTLSGSHSIMMGNVAFCQGVI